MLFYGKDVMFTSIWTIATMLILLLTGRSSDSWNTWGRSAETSGSWKGNSEGGLRGWAEL